MSDLHELRPARPDADDERPAYMPKVPWKWILGILGFVALAVGIHQVREREAASALRTALLKAHGTELGPLVARYEATAKKLRTLTYGATRQPKAATKVDPRLRLDALGSSKGLYMRIRPEKVTRPEDVDNASFDMTPDAIGRCLGLAPLSASELLARGTFLEPSWIKQAEETDDVMRLRVIEEQLRQRTKRDLAFVAEALEARWFLLVLERGDNRRDAPVDAYLWDLRSEQLLLSSRAQAEGALVSARIAVSGVTPGHYASGAQTGAAQDCSIASQLRAVAGAEPTTFQSAPPAPQQAMGTAPAAAAPAPSGAARAVAPAASAPGAGTSPAPQAAAPSAP